MVYSEKFISTCSHINIVRLTLGAFSVHEWYILDLENKQIDKELKVKVDKMRIDSQMSLAEKMPYASLVLDNNGSLDDLKEKVKSAINDLTSSS